MEERTKYLIKEYREYISSRDIYFNYINDYKSFTGSLLKHTREILNDNDTLFNFERKGNSREGAFTQKRSGFDIDGKQILVKVIKIRKDIEFVNQIHVYLHELTHLINNHNNQELNDIKLSTPQKEYVAETVSQSLLFSFVGGMLASELPPNNKWEQDEYITRWITNAKFSDKKIKEMWRQIIFSYNKITDVIIKNC